MHTMDLIEFCYGPDITLYEILKIAEDAPHKDVQLAFTERRMELYQLLQALNNNSRGNTVVVKTKGGKEFRLSEQTLVEKKMDALVAGFRILADPKKRRRYDTKLNKSRSKRNSRSSPISRRRPNRSIEQERSSPKSVFDVEDPPSVEEKENNWLPGGLQIADIESNDNDEDDRKEEASSKVKGVLNEEISSKEAKRQGSVKTVPLKDASRFSLSKSFSRADSRESTTTTSQSMNSTISSLPDSDDEDIEQYYRGVVAKRETTLGSWLRSKNFHSHANSIDNASNEIVGSVADVWLSLNQVFSAFSVDEEAIDAISGDITEATRDLHSGKYV